MTYRIHITDVAEAEAEQEYLWLMGVNPDAAGRWYDGLFKALESLTEMPHRFPVAPREISNGPDIRIMLYGNRPNTFRILFKIFGREDEGVTPGEIRVLRIVHGARELP